ncbi:hypothetical protein [Natrialba sp. SSL1]|uniref:hypothetical protein n=1 Tax=Natrialba sp. SSL1 TaxID=1869245 RepID=UPI0008F8BDAE|nr:hypothetical protein [Natrialba sp. SSL1]OIB56171.1 hypothetical protein BBD46_19390 [Natrialba sp. SSL1]
MSESKQSEDVEYAPLTEAEFKENLAQLFDAMNALAPTRNYVSQMVQLLPQERRQMRHAYPDLFEQMETQEFLNDGFGLEIDEEEVSTGRRGTATEIESFVDDIMEFFDDDDRRQALEEYLDDEIPNPRKEWLDHRVKMAVSEPNYGEEINTIFDTMLKYGDQQNGYRLEIDRVNELSDIDQGRLLEIKRFLVSELEICRDRNDKFELASEIMDYPDIIDQNL